MEAKIERYVWGKNNVHDNTSLSSNKLHIFFLQIAVKRMKKDLIAAREK
jgi:hypothetical protein